MTSRSVFRRIASGFIFLLCVSTAFLSGAAVVETVDTSDYPRLVSLEKLIDESSAARMIESSGLQVACEKRDQARALLLEAKNLIGEGADPERINDLIAEATREMLSAARLVKQDATASAVELREFDSMLESTAALLDAYVRIQSEDRPYTEKDELHLMVEANVAQATQLKERGDLQQGRALLSEAYSAAQAAIEHLRGGETLVRSLHFETKAEEYVYEIDRNDSLRMLVDVLLRDRIAGNERLADQVHQFVAKAGDLRGEGEALAQQEQYVEAIETLEASTTELIRAIRSAGIYIPQ